MVRKSKYTKELLDPIVKKNFSVSGVLRDLGLKTTGGNHRNISTWIRYHNIDKSHFTGATWNKGKTKHTSKSVLKTAIANSLSNEEFFSQNAKPTGGSKIAKRLLELDWKYCCNICGLEEWLDKEISLHVDHINGIHNDNRFENLQFLCPNCHQQTKTWGNPNKR